jgi:hypothetical protein
MPQVSWTATPRGEYWIDVSLGGLAVQVLVDTGLLDALGEVGFSVEPLLCDSIDRPGGFQSHQTHLRLVANGQIAQTDSGSLYARLIDPQTRNPVGPVTFVFVYRGAAGVPDRVGPAFLHRLNG